MNRQKTFSVDQGEDLDISKKKFDNIIRFTCYLQPKEEKEDYDNNNNDDNDDNENTNDNNSCNIKDDIEDATKHNLDTNRY